MTDDKPALAGSDPPAHQSGFQLDDVYVEEGRVKEWLLAATGHDCGHGGCRQARKMMPLVREYIQEWIVRSQKATANRIDQLALPLREGPDAGGRVQPDAPTIEKCDLECGDFWFKGKVCRHGRTAEQMR